MTDTRPDEETLARDEIAEVGRSLFERGLTFGSTGNISVRLSDGWLMTPTGVSLGSIIPSRLSRFDAAGKFVSGDQPTKEAPLHFAMYHRRNDAAAVLHLHSTYAVAVSLLDGLDAENVLPPLTAYYVMRVGELPLLPYYPPGDAELAVEVSKLAIVHHAILLANHGPIVAGTSLSNAQFAAEELEETAKLFLMLRDEQTKPLNREQTAELKRQHGLR